MYNSPGDSAVHVEPSAFLPYLDGGHFPLPEVVISDTGAICGGRLSLQRSNLFCIILKILATIKTELRTSSVLHYYAN
jgi:hypothetical protein